MKRLMPFCFLALTSLPASAANEYIATPDTTTGVQLSNTNPNRFHCVNGNVNDVVFPKDIPMEAVPKNSELFVSYKVLDDGMGMLSYVEKAHDLHVVCAGEVFTFSVTPVSDAPATTVRMGNPNKKIIDENAKLLQDKSVEELYSYLIINAFNNDYQGNITGSEVYIKYAPLVPGVTIELVRELVMAGAGLRLKEFVLTAEPGTNVQKEKFIVNELSPSMLAITTHPPVVGDDGKARLFIVESRL